MEPQPEIGPSAQDWMKRESEVEAVAFRKSFEAIMCKADNIDDFEKFMSRSNEHPRFVWLDLLLSSPSKIKSRNESVETELASLMWTQIIKYFPDVLHRELFLDGLNWISLKEKIVDRFGALHGAVLCGRPEIVQLLSDHRTNAKLIGKAICRPLIEFLLDPDRQSARVSSDYFNSIKRAVLWSHLPNPNEYKRTVAFMTAFERAKDSDNERDLDSMFRTGHGLVEEGQTSSLDADGVTPDKWTISVWTVIVAWASASGRGDIIERFKNMRREYFDALGRSRLWKSLFSESLEAIGKNEKDKKTVNLQVTYTKGEPDRRLVVEKIVKIVNQVMTIVDEGPAHNDNFTQLCSMYSISYRVPTSHPRRNFCNGGWTAIHLAAAVGDHAVLDTLVTSYDLVLKKFPADWKLKGQDGSGHTTIRKFLQDSLFDTLLMTPLHHAVLGNHLHVAKALLKWDFFLSHVNAFDLFQRTAFQIACSDSARVSILKKLVSGLGIDTNSKDCCGFTPLHWAVYVGAIDVVRILVSPAVGVRPMAKSDKGQHPHRVAEDLDLVKKKDIQALLESISEVKDGVERVYRDRQVYVDAANAILVGAALIASVTFGGWLQPPLGDGQEATHTKVHVYWLFNSLSFFLAIGTVMAGAESVLPRADVYIEDAVESIRTWLVTTAFLFICSIVFVLGAFAAAGFVSSSLVSHLNINMISTTSLGTAICSVLGISFCLRLFRIRQIEWWKRLQNTLKWRKEGTSLSDTSTHIRKLFRDFCFRPLKESHGGQDDASLQLVRKSCKDVIAYKHANNKLPEMLTEKLHRLSGQQVCHIRRCYKGLELESTVEKSYDWLNENFLSENSVMWKRILEKLTLLGTAAKRPERASFLFQDEIGGYSSNFGTESLERYGVVRVEKDKELLRHLENLNRQGHDDLLEDYESTPIELKVPICCGECVAAIEFALYTLKGVRSVKSDIRYEKVTIIGKVKPEDALLEARKLFKKSRMWVKEDDN